MTLFDPDDAHPAALEGPLVRVRLLVAYDGGRYHGFAPQPGVKTVGGTLAKSIERVLQHPVDLTCAGRTDAGVHAWGQVVTFDARAEDLDLGVLQRSLNKLCAPAIVVREASEAPSDFDARFSARSRRYRYTVLNRPVPDPFLAAYAWHVDAPLDLANLRLGCDPLIGEHDFSSFCRRPKTETDVSLVRRVLHADWIDAGDGLLRFEIEATSFCHQMVRSLTGTLVEVGLGKKHPGELTGILRARDRGAAGNVAPPHGLSLWEVTYES